MTIEETLKEYILKQYKSLRRFCLYIDVPYSTIDNMLKKKLDQSSVSTVIKVCDSLNIDLEALLQGQLVEKPFSIDSISTKEISLIKSYRNHPEVQHAVDLLLGLSDTSGD